MEDQHIDAINNIKDLIDGIEFGKWLKVQPKDLQETWIRVLYEYITKQIEPTVTTYYIMGIIAVFPDRESVIEE